MIVPLKKRIEIAYKGSKILMIFLISTLILGTLFFLGCFGLLGLPSFERAKGLWIPLGILIFICESILFWDGILRIYLTSVQLGLKLRILGAIFGLLIPVNIFILIYMIHIVRAEYRYEMKKIKLNEERSSLQICKTKYPILMIHGVFFRDFKHFNYWGRIPDELEKNGAKVFYGNQQSAESVGDSGKRIAEKIREICKSEDCEKVNIIAHSKGGLESRWAISMEEMAPHVASLTTINTPHRGCHYAAFLLSKISKKHQFFIARIYNKIFREIGDPNPDFLASVKDLTVEACEKFNERVKDSPSVYYQSVGSRLNRRRGGQFPLNITYPMVKKYDGINDGLVGKESCPWGEKFQYIEKKCRRGITHGDMIDLNRKNLKSFDVREFYVQLVKDLKDCGF